MKTEIVVPRFAFSLKSTIGHLDVEQECWGVTLEDRVRLPGVKVYGMTAIPPGLYKLDKRESPKLKRMVIWIRNVPGFEYAYFHSGNKPEDTLACILTADKRTAPDYIAGSSLAIERRLYNFIDARGWDDAWLTIVNLPGFEKIIAQP